MIIQDWLRQSQQELVQSGSNSAEYDARLLLASALQKPTSYLFTWPEKTLTDSQLAEANALLARRLKGEPVAYIFAEQEFYGRPFTVTSDTLIPRPETELLIDQALALLPTSEQRILDLGTGTGAIALTLAMERPEWQVLSCDISEAAVAVAQQNQQQLQASNCNIVLSSWFNQISGTFDAIISNPPYIDEADPHLAQGDVRFEPRSALVSADHGLKDIAEIITKAKQFLKTGGLLMFEHGYQQGDAVAHLLETQGYRQVTTMQDYGGHDRVTFGYAQ